MDKARECFRSFLFPADSGRWLGLLRIGLGLQVIGYSWALRHDWYWLFQSNENQPSIRTLTEAILSSQARFTPRLGWLIALGEGVGASEHLVLALSWTILFGAGVCLLAGLFCRPAAIASWFLYLCSAKSSALFAYGVDNFTTIGLFYLMIAPLPDRWSVDWRLRAQRAPDPLRLGFHRRVLQVHLCVIYFFGGVSKALGLEWWNGTSIWRALTRPPFDLVNPDLLLRFAPLLPAIGIVVVLLESGYAICIWPKRTRAIWLAGIIAMHLGIGLTMGLYLFASIMIVLNLAAFGPEFLPWPENPVRAFPKEDDASSAGLTVRMEEPG